MTRTPRLLRKAAAAVCVLAAAGSSLAYELTVVNASDRELRSCPVVLDMRGLPPELQRSPLGVRSADGSECPCQVDDLDGDGRPDELVILADLPGEAARRFKLVPGGRDGPKTALRVGDQLTFQNGFIRCRAEPRDQLGLRIDDAKTGRSFVPRAFLAHLRKARARTRVLAGGPVRAVIEQTFEDPPLAVSLRYALYAGRPGVDFRVTFRNTGDKPHRLSLLKARNLVEVYQGELIVHDIRNTDVVSVNQWTAPNRPNILWANRTTNRALGVAFHSPAWKWKGIMVWARSLVTPEGVAIHSTPTPPGRKPITPKHWIIEKDGRMALGRAQERISEGRYLVYKTSRHRGEWDYAELAPGEAVSYGFTLFGYRASRDEAVEAFEADADRAVSVVNVHGPDGAPLAIGGAPYYVTETFDDAERWFADSDARMEVGEGKVVLTASKPGAGIATALCRDFDDPTLLRGKVELSPNASLKLVLEDTADGTEYPLGLVDGDFSLWLGRQVKKGWLPLQTPDGKKSLFGVRKCVLTLALVPREGAEAGPLRAELDELVLGWPEPAAPTFESPPSDFPLTDIALSFQWMPQTYQQCDRGYELEIAKDAEFRQIAARYTRHNLAQKRRRENDPQTFIPPDVFPLGTYYARIRALGIATGPSPWSEAQKFAIGNADHAPRPPRRTFAPREPVFVLLCVRAADPDKYETFYESLPKAIQAITISQSGSHKYPRVLRLGGHTIEGHVDLATLEKLLATNTHPNLLGWMQGEGGGTSGEMAFRYLTLAGKYGCLWGGPLPGTGQKLYDLLKTHGKYCIPCFEHMNPYRNLVNRQRFIGMFLTGRLKQYGTGAQIFHMVKVRIKPEDRAGLDWMSPLLMGLAYGAQLYRFEGFVTEKFDNCGWDIESEQFGPAWTRAVGPFFEDLLVHQLIPTQQEVWDAVKVAFQPRLEKARVEARLVEYIPYGVYNAVHGVPTHWYQYVPDNARVGIVPILPPLATAEERARFRAVVDPHAFDSPEQAANYVEAFYPPRRVGRTMVISQAAGGWSHAHVDVPELRREAFQVLVGDTGVVVNSEEFGDRAVPQPFNLAFTKGPVEHVEGEVDYHQYCIFKQYEDRLFVHANNYEGKLTELSLCGNTVLSARVVPAEALVEQEWDGKSMILRLTLSHRHQAGVARAVVE